MMGCGTFRTGSPDKFPGDVLEELVRNYSALSSGVGKAIAARETRHCIEHGLKDDRKTFWCIATGPGVNDGSAAPV